jgi:uncharacterized protein YggU (UPF0235/DUF167 family)
VAEGVMTGRINVHLTPRGGRDAINGWGPAGDGGAEALQVRVAAPAVGGAANASLCRLIAKAAGVPASAVSIRSGLHSRAKVLEIDGPDSDVIRAHIDAYLTSTGGR